ncbi:Argininosuccinate lyase [Candidatus Sulfobium mesophilum]|uniref:Argininosuccinate lyase n=1 Tax=Candidatus Sulfobium mesophilum TaxID=2016548 RepID=A0A2U3QFK4_9BACT|nr:Argininosuccinate lyase [Candidatus Sulfobium mesophilum]
MKKPWSGRFAGKTSEIVESFSESISFDKRLWRHEIEGSVAHARMLGMQGIISKKEAAAIVKGLREIASDIEGGRFKFSEGLEDIHMNIEAALIKKIGSAGRKLHTARSRNDQVALDMRLYLREETKQILSLIINLQKTILQTAGSHVNTIMPGFTHTQRAQPVLLSHHLLAYVEMLQRDKLRFEDSMKRLNILPLGSCALAGTTLPIDREYVAKALGFASVSRNSIDAVSDRDFAIEFLACASITAAHLSRLSEELVLWSTEEFGFIEISDAFTTGSSIMPQKKNPDVAELVRGKTGRVYASLICLLTLMKALPLSYNRDMQEDKPPVFDAADTLKACLSVTNAMLPEISFNTEKMLHTAAEGYSTATDLAEYLVKKGVPFRQAHEITGKVVRYCINNKKDLQSLNLKELKSFSRVIEADVFKALGPCESVKSRSSYGGTSPSEVMRQIRYFRKTLK